MGMQDKVAATAGKALLSPVASVKGRLVLCFDGTGNRFNADTSDTNVVQLYKMFDRNDPKQWHYYQPGIGTYSTGTENINVDGWLAKKYQSFQRTMDQGFANSFDEHVAAGYKFLMRYYDPGDKIYIFGFSRGAFTARFLARMINEIGLLSKGNEELIPFAYTYYQTYEQGTVAGRREFLGHFKETFCRPSTKVHFLGLFDCVRSVANFEAARPVENPVIDKPACHVRHAVSLDECRAKFKPALFSMDESNKANTVDNEERWFPGNHGDIGGGWETKNNDPSEVQLSSLALEWMLKELQSLPTEGDVEPIKFNDKADEFLKKMSNSKTREEALTSRVHSVLKWNGDKPWWKVWPWGGDTKWYKVLFWKMLEYLPFARKTIKDKQWVITRKLNKETRRPIPDGAILDVSVLERMNLVPEYGETFFGQEGIADALATCQKQNTQIKLKRQPVFKK